MNAVFVPCPHCAQRCSRCRGRGGWFSIHKPVSLRVVDFNPIGGLNMLLHLNDGSVGTAHYNACPQCDRAGLTAGPNESQADVDAWARSVGFQWPTVEPRIPEDTARASGEIDSLRAVAG